MEAVVAAEAAHKAALGAAEKHKQHAIETAARIVAEERALQVRFEAEHLKATTLQEAEKEHAAALEAAHGWRGPSTRG